MIWILDASVALKWFLVEEVHPNTELVLRKVIDSPELFAVPELFCFEVYSVLCRIHPLGQEAYIKGIIPLINSGIYRYPMTEVLASKAGVFVDKGLTGYDACYAALAREMQGIWLTFDEKAHLKIRDERVSHYLAESMPEDWGNF